MPSAQIAAFRQSSSDGGDALPELAVVRTLAVVRAWNGVAVPAGSEGTIVSVLGGGAAYDVEFTEPVALATVDAAALQVAASPGDASLATRALRRR